MFICLDAKNILFAYEDKNKLRNYIFVVAKYYIYSNKFSQKDLNLNSFLRMLKGKFQSEKHIAYMNNNITAFFAKWGPLYNYFNTI